MSGLIVRRDFVTNLITVSCVLVSTAAVFFGGGGMSRNGAVRNIPKNGCAGD